MCGRYALSATAGQLIEHFQLLSCPDYEVRYNIAPTSIIPVIRYKPDAGRVGQLVKWGLVPSWAKDASIGAKLNNARGETVAEKPSFRTSFAKHRCLIPASGFYEWKTVEGKKQPYYIYPTDGLFAFAGLLAAWKAPDGQTLVTTCIITTEPNEVMVPIHDRMPVILGADQYDAWLDPLNHDVEALKQMIRPCSAERMTAYPVSPLINNGRAEGGGIAEIDE
uniref:Abasic site processing protein n=1 Tax=Dechloromonas aromatica (strain RCB) TaxID=159087 RepID=Q47CL6_DECAR